MPEYLAPGVYVEEISTGPKPIEGVSTSVAGFLGPTERGPEDIRYISSWLEFQRVYGGHLGEQFSYLSYAVQGFFDNGGKRCYVGRITKKTTATRASVAVSAQLTLSAVGRGGWGKRVFYKIFKATQAKDGTRTANWVRVKLYYYKAPLATTPPPDPDDKATQTNPIAQRPDVTEDFDNLSLDPRAGNSIDTAINAGSQLVVVEYTGDANTTLTPVTALTVLGDSSDGVGDVTPDDYVGDPGPIDPNKIDLFGQGTGRAGMSMVGEVALLIAPDHVKFGTVTGDDLSTALVADCTQLRDRFAILSTARLFKVEQRPDTDTTFAAIYYPWIKIYDTYTSDDIYVPPTGHVAGLIANTDIQVGVHKAPANAVLVGAKDLLKPVPKADQDNLNPIGVNCVRDFRADGRGIRVWGARTMSSDPEWKYINVRRLFLMIEESIDQGTQWVVFEPNAPVTWARVVRAITNFLTTLWRNGALFGTTPADAFFVRCDSTTMTDDDIENGRLICYVGVAPVRPAEFVIIRIGQKTADAQS